MAARRLPKPGAGEVRMMAVEERPASLEQPLTVKEAAELLRVTEPTLRGWLREGKIRGHRVGGFHKQSYRWRIPRSEIERLTT